MPHFSPPHPGNGVVDRLQRLESLRHEDVGELLVDRLHPPRHLQDPLLVRVRGVVVRRGAAKVEWGNRKLMDILVGEHSCLPSAN